MWKPHLWSVFLCLSWWTTLCVCSSAQPNESSPPKPLAPFSESFRKLPQLQALEREFLKRFLLGQASVKSQEGQQLLARSRACISAFEMDIDSPSPLSTADFSWRVEKAFDPETQRPFIPLLDQITQLALLDVADRMESQNWEAGLDLLYKLHWSARLLNREPVLFAQVSSYANEIFCLKIWARYYAFCPKALREGFTQKQENLPPLGDGKETLVYDRNAAYDMCSRIVGLPLPIQNPQALIATLRQAIQNADPDQKDQREITEVFKQTILHLEALEEKYQRLHQLWTGDYAPSLAAIIQLHDEFRAKDHIAFAIHVPYFNFFRKTREHSVYQNMFLAGRTWIDLAERPSENPLQSSVLDPRFRLPFQMQITTSEGKQKLLVTSPGEGNEKLQLSFDLK